MRHLDLERLAAAVAIISSEQKRDRLCQIIGHACELESAFFDWSEWLRACGVETPTGTPAPQFEASGDGFIRFGTETSPAEYLRLIAETISGLETAERGEVCRQVAAVYSASNRFFDQESWARACQASDAQPGVQASVR